MAVYPGGGFYVDMGLGGTPRVKEHFQCSQCLEALIDCRCGPAAFRAVRNALFGETGPGQAVPETVSPGPVVQLAVSPEAITRAREKVAAAEALRGKVFVQEAWRRVVDGLPEGYTPVPYPKWQFHPTWPARIVETREEHLALYAEDARWTEAPTDDLLALFLKELQ